VPPRQIILAWLVQESGPTLGELTGTGGSRTVSMRCSRSMAVRVQLLSSRMHATTADANPLGSLRHPLWWTALALLILNDHLFKGSGYLPGWLTGKLSDFAGMIVAPPLLAVALGVKSRRGWYRCLWAVGVPFALIKSWPAVAGSIDQSSMYFGLRCDIRCDPWDLMALPALLLAPKGSGSAARVSLRSHVRNVRRPLFARLEFIGILIGSIACLATGTSAPRYPNIASCADNDNRSAQPRRGSSIFNAESADNEVSAGADVRIDAWSSYVCSRKIFYLSQHGEITAIEIATDRRLFTAPIDCEDCRIRLALSREQLFVFSRHPGDARNEASEWVFALDALTGKVLWYRKLEATSVRAHGLDFEELPYCSNGTLVVYMHAVPQCFDARTGEPSRYRCSEAHEETSDSELGTGPNGNTPDASVGEP
jgi:hypothetical protein